MPQLSKKCAETPAENKNQWLEMLLFSEVCYEFGCSSTSYLTRNVAISCQRACGQRAFFRARGRTSWSQAEVFLRSAVLAASTCGRIQIRRSRLEFQDLVVTRVRKVRERAVENLIVERSLIFWKA